MVAEVQKEQGYQQYEFRSKVVSIVLTRLLREVSRLEKTIMDSSKKQLVIIQLMIKLQLIIKKSSNPSILEWRTGFGYFWYLIIVLLALPSVSGDLSKLLL